MTMKQLEPLVGEWEGPLTADGTAIEGAWHISDDGSEWRKDFDLTYRRR